MRLVGTPAEALSILEARWRVYVEGGSGHPDALARALVESGLSCQVVTSVMGPAPIYCDSPSDGVISILSFRGSAETKEAYLRGQLDVVPTGLAAIPRLLHGVLRPDAALIKTSPPDDSGWCSLGTSVLYNQAAIESARVVIAEFSSFVPRTFGDGGVHVSQIDIAYQSNEPLIEQVSHAPIEAERAVARHAVEFVPDGAVVQVGMGGIGDAVAAELASRKNLTIHSGLVSDAMLFLAESGALARAPGAITTGALMGTSKLYEWAKDNPTVQVRRVEFTHDANVLSHLAPFVAINGALEVDHSGQVNGETIRGVPLSGAGGSLDFAHGAISAGGISIIGVTSRSRRGAARVVESLTLPATVNIPRTEVDVVVTEHGAADLRGLGLKDRARALSAIGADRHSLSEGDQP